MAIHPQFAQAILQGNKRIEFRKRRLAPDINVVLIYESAPTQRIVGQFTIGRTELATPSSLWRSFGAIGSIRRSDYLTYFGDSPRAVGLVIDAAERYRRPVALGELSLRPSVPQSFTYLPASVLEEIFDLQQYEALGWGGRQGELGASRARQSRDLAPLPSCCAMAAPQSASGEAVWG